VNGASGSDTDCAYITLILGSSPLLEDFYALFRDELEYWAYPPGTFALHNLRRLMLDGTPFLGIPYCAFLEYILESLDAPCLRSLSLHNESVCDRCPELVSNVLTRCSPNLTSLSLGVRFDDTQTARCLKSAPKVEILHLGSDKTTEVLEAALQVCSDGVFDLCPALKACFIVVPKDRLRSMEETLLARWPDGRCAFGPARGGRCAVLYPADWKQFSAEWTTVLGRQAKMLHDFRTVSPTEPMVSFI